MTDGVRCTRKDRAQEAAVFSAVPLEPDAGKKQFKKTAENRTTARCRNEKLPVSYRAEIICVIVSIRYLSPRSGRSQK